MNITNVACNQLLIYLLLNNLSSATVYCRGLKFGRMIVLVSSQWSIASLIKIYLNFLSCKMSPGTQAMQQRMSNEEEAEATEKRVDGKDA